MKIMLIDDDSSLHSLLRHVCYDQGWQFCGAKSGKEALSTIPLEAPDLILLDIMMPGMNGFEVCERIRAENETVPILFLSAKQDIVDKSIGFKAGGDDYITKPFDLDELLLRIEARVKRSQSLQNASKPPRRSGTLVIGAFEFLFDEYAVRKNGTKLPLTSKEFEILSLLASSPGKVFTREQIYEHIWNENALASPASITVFIRKIREKIEDNPSKPEHLLTVWRVGYKFAAPTKPEA